MQRSQTMVSLTFVDQVFSDKLLKLTRETKMAKRAIKKIHNKMLNNDQKHMSIIMKLK